MKLKIFVVMGLIAIAVSVWFLNAQPQMQVAAKKGSIVESIYGLGTVMSDQVYSVKVGTPLTVQKIFVKEGEPVQAGDSLMQVDDVLFKSKIAGTVTAINFKQGELVNPQVPLMIVTNLKALYLEVSLEQQSVLRVKKNQEVRVSFESLRSEKMQGIVTQVYPRDKQFIVRVEMQSWPEGVLPGMTADLAIQVGVRNDSLLIPINSIRGGYVTRVRGRHKEKMNIKVGIVNENWAEVLSGDLTEGDLVLVRGQ